MQPYLAATKMCKRLLSLDITR